MKISACTIVKNEEKNIQKWYDTTKQYADEIIIVDTGSTDRTLNILEKLPIKLYYYEWHDDFAAAKNYAIDKATGDWIVFLDADEYFKEEIARKVKEIIIDIISNNSKIDGVLCPIINIDKKNNKEISRFYNLRIFRNAVNLRYKGKIHEQLVAEDKELILVKNAKLIVYHTGYSVDLAKEKAQRNLEILLGQNNNSADLIPWHYIADCYYGLGEYEKTIECLDKYFLDSQYTVLNNECSLWRNYINAMLQLKKNSNEILEKIFTAIKIMPDLPDFYAFAGFIYYNEEKYLMAKKYLNKALKTYNNSKLTMTGSAFSADIDVVNNKLMQIRKILQNRLTVSSCVIVKNNEKDIVKWLESVKKFSDEIIVVDTGCTDKTIDIVKKTDAFVYQYQWQDDFAAAKNFAIDKAIGDWIVIMDSDEYILPRVNLKNILKSITDENIDALFSRMINIDADDNNKEINRFLQTRIFRNHRNIYYKGKIHEQLYKDGNNLQQAVYENIIIYHTGYSKQRYLAKMKRNLKILQYDIEKNGENKRYFRYLADCYFALENYTKAVYFYNKHLASGLKSMGNENEVYYNLIEAMFQLNYNLQDILLIVQKANDIFKNYPQFLMQYGKIHFYLKNYEKARIFFEKALQLHKTIVQNADNFIVLIPEIYRCLVKIYSQRKDCVKMAFYIDKLLLTDKYNLENIKCLFVLLKQMSWQESLVYINKYYNNNLQDYLSLIDGSFWTGTADFFAYYNNKLYEEYNIISEKRRLRDIMIKNDKEYNELLVYSAEKIKTLVSALLMLNKLPEEYHTILPRIIWSCLQAYYDQKELKQNEFSTYMVLLPTVILKTNDSILEKYILLIEDFPVNEKKQAIIGLCNLKKWQHASLLLTEELVNANIKDIELVLIFAKCNYYARKWDVAEEYFKHILAIEDNNAEVQSYLIWINERRAGKW